MSQTFDRAFVYRMLRNKTLYIKPERELFLLCLENNKEGDSEDEDMYPKRIRLDDSPINKGW